MPRCLMCSSHRCAPSPTTARCSLTCSPRSCGCSEGADVLAVHERAVALARAARAGDAERGRSAGRARRGPRPRARPSCSCARSRAGSSSPTSPRTTSASGACARARRGGAGPAPGSLRDAVQRLAADGTHRAEPSASCSRQAEVRLVLTAHPTEARRRTTLEKLARVFGVLRDLDERAGRAARRGAARRLLADGPGAVGLRRAARGVADGARRGARRPRVLRHDAAPTRCRRSTATSRPRSPRPTRRADRRCRRC